ncbi:unnamed protein product [Brachionus calyciflorus]|uniref:Uncharacterized protein n=1 Tax=Brachionus calyciflorus TaxID=104777 RepID=A0A814IDV9_9BILA|nr:unnamed protein product [Brachionus calyciflorus]
MDSPVTQAPTTTQVNIENQAAQQSKKGSCGDCGVHSDFIDVDFLADIFTSLRALLVDLIYGLAVFDAFQCFSKF